jgi:hypothetical protein
MSMKRITALLVNFCYKLQHHYVMQISLRNWLWFLIVVPPVVAILGRLSWIRAILLFLLGGLMLLGVEWARQKRYLVFEPTALEQDAVVPVLIQPDEQIAGRVSGLFAVGGKQRYVVNGIAQLSYVRTREHIVMTYIKQTRFLLLARSVKQDVGWWYVFFHPSHVQRVETGYVWCGARARPGLALSYLPEGQPGQDATIYMAFADVGAVWRVIANLCIDVPSHTTAT